MKTKYFYYVIVLSEDTAKFITNMDNLTKIARWEKDKEPLPLTKSTAEDLAYCLSLNFHPAYVLKSYHKISSQIFIKE